MSARTGDLDLVPELRLAPLRTLSVSILPQLTGMDVTLALDAVQTASVIIRHAGRDRAQLRDCLSSVEPRQPLRTLLLQLLRELLDGEGLEDVLGRGGEQR